MKCNSVSFTYRGGNPAGRILADLLGDISIDYATDNGYVTADLASTVAELEKRLLAQQKAEEASASKSTPSIITAISPVHVRDRNVLQWLRAMNVPIGTPVTLQFVDDLSSKHISFDPDPSRDAGLMRYKIEFRNNTGSWSRSSRFPELYSEREAMRLIDEGNSADPSGWERRKVRA